ncbi:hypothetical protein [Succinimonas amylolytica]|uniref:hypothetical protein n=1 Tax=Succinimonas amylolytica TaxID=83769 RepID=UPI0003810B11|nr:hypothetical protein [Succinimonas amylolytica]
MPARKFISKSGIVLGTLLLLSSAFPAHAVSESSGCQAVVIENQSLRICPEFVIGDNGGSSDIPLSPADSIGVYDNKTVYSRTNGPARDPEILGFVSDDSGGFILKNTLTFKCRKNAPDCAPDSLRARKLSKTVYLVKAGSIAEWQELYRTISALPDVANISISKDYGLKMNLR